MAGNYTKAIWDALSVGRNPENGYEIFRMWKLLRELKVFIGHFCCDMWNKIMILVACQSYFSVGCCELWKYSHTFDKIN